MTSSHSSGATCRPLRKTGSGTASGQPTGQCPRRAGFFHEFLTARTLDFPGVAAGNPVPALDGDAYFTAAQAVNHPCWRVRNNLPGTHDYCPLVLRTARVREAEQFDCAAHLADLEAEFGADLLQRSAVWLTAKKSRASFAIEHEEQHVDRVRRFAALMECCCAQLDDPLSESIRLCLHPPNGRRQGPHLAIPHQ